MFAQDVITLGVVTKPGAGQNICAERFKKLLEKKSSFRVSIYDSGSLGTETDILKQISNNTLRMGIITSGPFDTFVPEARVIDYPFLFKDYHQADAILDGPLGQELLNLLERANFKGLAFAENGFRHVSNSKKPINRPEDVAGLKLRVMESRVHEAFWSIMGASPVPLGSLRDVRKGLTSGSIDGQENPLAAIWENQFFKGQKYLTLTGHVYSSHICVASLKWFSTLKPSDKKTIQECMQEAARYEREWNRKNEESFLGKLKKAGLEINEQPDMRSFRIKAAGMREADIFRGKAMQELLAKFIKATEGGIQQTAP
jgi:tripartite ATP-independent transporter DctP family solute receptor